MANQSQADRLAQYIETAQALINTEAKHKPPKDGDLIELIISGISSGINPKQVCQAVGVDETSLKNLLKNNPRYLRAIRLTKLQSEMRLVKKLSDSKDWKAQMALLAVANPNKYNKVINKAEIINKAANIIEARQFYNIPVKLTADSVKESIQNELTG